MKKDVKKTFLELVTLSSPSKQEKRVADYIRKRLTKLGLQVIEDDTAKAIQGECGNLIVKLDGKGTSILFDAHMDTVRPCEIITPLIKEGKIYSDQSSILGADDKAGIAAMICMLEEIVEQKLPHPPITCIFSVCEEESLQGVKHLNTEYIKDVRYAYVLDGEGEVGSVVSRTPYGCKGTLNVIGKAAHAGVCPEKGINALRVASKAIVKLPIGRVNEHLTCNIGSIKGGTASNIVMEEVTMQFEARGYNLETLTSFIQTVKRTFQDVCNQHHAVFQEDLHYGTPGYHVKEQEDIITTFHEVCNEISLPFQMESCGGGSNANIYRMKGIDALCLGIHMKEVHSCNEYIDITDLYKTYDLLMGICRYMCDD